MPTSDGTITTADICNQAIVESKLRDASVVSVKLAADLQSDTWDGTTVAAEDATTGWRIERNTGNIGVGAAYVRGALTAATIAADDITAGTLAAGVIYTGTIRAKDVIVGNYDNLISDPDFQFTGDESGDAGALNPTAILAWAPFPAGGTWEIDTAINRSGPYSARYDPTGQTAACQLYASGDLTNVRANPRAVEGDQIYAEAYVRAGAAGACNDAQIIILWRDSSHANLAFSVGTLTEPTTTWQKLSITGTAPANSAYILIYVSINNDGNTNAVHFANFYARRMVEGSIVVDGSIEANHIAANTITVTQISPTAGITGGQIASTTITGGNIDTGTITASNIQAGTITGTEIAGTTITAGNIVAGTITGTEIAPVTITAANIQNGTITGTQIAGTTITGSNIQNGTITGTQIGSATITGSNIAGGTITGSLISDATITTAKLISVSGDIISGGTISGMTIEGGTIQTSGSGRRVKLDGTGDQIELYSASGSVGTIAENSGQLRIDGTTLYFNATSAVSLYGTAADWFQINSTANDMYRNNSRVMEWGDGFTRAHSQIRLDNGSAGSPQLKFTDDQDTGIFRQTSITGIGFSVGATERFSISSSAVTSASGVNIISNAAFRASDSGSGYVFSTDTDSGMYNVSNGRIGFRTNSTDRLNISTTNIETRLSMNPNANNTYDVGTTGNRYRTIYLVNSPDVSSDLSLKKHVRDLPFDPNQFVADLRPIMFKWKKHGESGGVRDHAGFHMGSLEAALEKHGDFGAYTNPAVDPTITNTADGYKGIRFNELVPILWAAVQKLQERVTVLEAP